MTAAILTWLSAWGIPLLIAVFVVVAVALWHDLKRLPYRRYEKPIEGANGMYLPASWKPRDER